MRPDNIFQIPVNHKVLVKLIWPEIASEIIIGNKVPKSPKLPEIYSTQELFNAVEK